MVLIVLAAVWAAVLLPPILRSRSQHRPSGSISDFRRQLHVLARTSPTYSPPPGHVNARIVPIRQGAGSLVAAGSAAGGQLRLGRKASTIKRRRDIFVGLLVAMAGSLVLGALPPLRVLWMLHVVLDLAFVAYVATLIYLRNAAAEREMKVRFLPNAAAEPALLLRRSVN